MNKKKNVREKGGRNADNSDAETNTDQQRGLSKEAWIAIGTIVAALITGTVTVLIHVLPQASQPSPAASSPSPSAASSSRPIAANADPISGKWAGTAQDTDGPPFKITLAITKACTPGQRCGSISVSNVPCYGEIFLVKIKNEDYEFRVDNFYGRSDPNHCQPGAGEHFRLQPDGKLAYSTSYSPGIHGLLEKTGE